MYRQTLTSDRQWGEGALDGAGCRGDGGGDDALVVFAAQPVLLKQQIVRKEFEEGDSVVLPCNPPESSTPPTIHWMDKSECFRTQSEWLRPLNHPLPPVHPHTPANPLYTQSFSLHSSYQQWKSWSFFPPLEGAKQTGVSVLNCCIVCMDVKYYRKRMCIRSRTNARTNGHSRSCSKKSHSAEEAFFQ